MSAAAMHLAVLRLPWQRRRFGSPWASLTTLLVLPAGLAAMGLLLRLGLERSVILCALGLLSTLWHLQAEGLLGQNLALLARHLPGQLRVLRLQLLLSGVAAALLGSLLLAELSGREAWAWLPFSSLIVASLAWLARLPLLWVVAWFPIVGMSMLWRQMDQLLSSPWLSLLSLLALLPLLGSGGGLHRRVEGLQQRLQAVARAQQTGEMPPGRMLGGVWNALARFFCWPQHWTRRRLERRPTPANALARIDAWLSGSGHWAVQLWLLGLFLLGLAALIAWLLLGLQIPDKLPTLLGNMGGAAIGLSAMLAAAATQKAQRLLSTRREQALLALLPGPAGMLELGRALRRRWLWQTLFANMAALLLCGTVLLLGPPLIAKMVGAYLAVLLFLPLLLLRDWSRLQKKPAFDVGGLMVVAGLAAAASLFQPWPAWGTPLLALPLAGALLVWQLRQIRHLPIQLPVGRR